MEQGHAAEHIHVLAGAGATDRWIWEHAKTCGSVIITKDQDFFALRTLDPLGPSVVWIRVGNTTRRALLDHLVPVWPAVIAALEQGETLVEVS